MNIQTIKKNHWNEIREIYKEAFPKSEQKPFFLLKQDAKKGKVTILVAEEEGKVVGFIVTIPYKNMIMVDYLAVSSKIRSRGTGSLLLQEVCRKFSTNKILLLIEKLDDSAENIQQRISRRKFYLKNGFESANYYASIGKGIMEILDYNGTVTQEEYLDIQHYALGSLFFRLAKVEVLSD